MPHLKNLLQIFFFHSQTCIKSNKHIFHWTSKFYKLSEVTGSDMRQLSGRITSLYNVTPQTLKKPLKLLQPSNMFGFW
jgi:hypothetical protein